MTSDKTEFPSSQTVKLLHELKHSRCQPEVYAAIENLLYNGSDFDCYKINAFRIAASLKLDRLATVSGFLIAAKLGLFDLTYDIHCASCRGIPEYTKHMMGLKNTAHCDLCELDWNLDFEDQVEVSFTVNPGVRPIDYVDWTQRDFAGKMQFLDDVLTREGRNFSLGECVHVNQTLDITQEFTPGRYYFYASGFPEESIPLEIESEAATGIQEVPIHYDCHMKCDTRHLKLKQGLIRFVVTAEVNHMFGFLILPMKPVHHFVSAAYISSLQDFKDLFSSEFLREDVSFGIRSITLLFTDIKDSTRMYEVLGDSKAYSKVQKHFDIMTEVIRSHNGGIVKTIGDAVMAAFANNLDAVKAARALHLAFSRDNSSDELQDVRIKLGLHRGPAIAVTSNRSLDYFGRTANIAARVQAQAAEDEVLISRDVLEDQDLQSWLQAANIHSTARKVHLKGIQGPMEVFGLKFVVS